jgi:protein-tyrosine-phosphatase
MAEIGIDITDDHSERLTTDDLQWADLVVVLEAAHDSFLRDEHPLYSTTVHLLAERVLDPFGRPLAVYRSRRDQLLKLLGALPALSIQPATTCRAAEQE